VDEQINKQETNNTEGSSLSQPSRRRWLQVTGGAAVALPVLGLAGCSGDDAKSAADSASKAASDAAGSAKSMAKDAADSAKSMASDATDSAKSMGGDAADKMKDMAGDAADSAKDMASGAADKAKAMAGGNAGGLVKIELSDPVAKALNYVADASTVDTGKNPRFVAGQNCANCAQYKAVGSDGWGSCAIFPGKLVAKGAWCSGYIASA